MNRISNKYIFFFIVITILSVSIAIFNGCQKQGYHMDELYSYGLANSSYLPFLHMGTQEYSVYDWMKEYGTGDNILEASKNFIKDFKDLANAGFSVKNTSLYNDYLIARENSYDTYTTTWLTGEYYKDYLTVNDNSRFNLASVYYNQRGDVHPPLFYIALNFVSSLFPGVFSKWFGISINICFLAVSLFVLFNICRKYLFSDLTSLLITASYGLSAAFSSTAIFIRMYALLTLMVLLFLYFNMSFLYSCREFTKKDFFKFAIITILGYMSHYYFVIYAISVAFVVVIILATRKNWKFTFKYICTLIISSVLGIIIWPFSIKHVFLGYRGTESINILKSGSFYFIKVKVILKYIFDNILCGNWWLPVCSLVLLLLVSIITHNFKINISKVIIIIVPVLTYIAIVSQIVPFLTDRYFMCTYPFVMIFTIGCISLGINKFSLKITKNDSNIKNIVLVTFSFIVVLLTCGITHSAMYKYDKGSETYIIPENTDCIYVLPNGDWNETSEEINILAQCKNTAVVHEKSIDTLKGYTPTDNTTIMICIRNSLDDEVVLDKIINSLALDSFSIISEGPDTGTFNRYFLR